MTGYRISKYPHRLAQRQIRRKKGRLDVSRHRPTNVSNSHCLVVKSCSVSTKSPKCLQLSLETFCIQAGQLELSLLRMVDHQLVALHLMHHQS